MDAPEPAPAERPQRAEPLPGRRRRRRRSRRRRILRAVEPFLLLVGLGLLSAGVIRVVETQVPTEAAAKDHRRLERARQQSRPEIESLAASLDPDWVPEVSAADEDWLDEPFLEHLDPFVALERSPVARRERAPSAEELADQLTTSISSTSNTSAEPPGIEGEGLASP